MIKADPQIPNRSPLIALFMMRQLSDVAEDLGDTSLRMTKQYAPFQADKLRAAIGV